MNVTVEMAQVPCAECGVVFCVPKSFDDAKRQSHERFFCPNGHHLSYGHKTVAEKRAEELAAQLAAEQRRRAECETRLRAARKPVEQTKPEAKPVEVKKDGRSKRGWTPERRAEASQRAKQRWTPEARNEASLKESARRRQLRERQEA